MRRLLTISCALIGFLFVLVSGLSAQSECKAPIHDKSTGFNIFTTEQETSLGDLIHRSVAAETRIIETPELVEPLRQVTDRLARHAEGSGYRFQSFLIDLPETNAFTIPGARIYISRKLIALTRSEDELAWVVAHEMGHQLVHHAANDMSEMWRDLLGITSLKDTGEVEQAYHRFLESYARKPGVTRRDRDDMEKNQRGADQIAIYLAARAGYDTKAFASFWDRLAETKGRTGSWLGDVFGQTKPEARRLREILKNTSALPEQCIELRKNSAEDYERWKRSVVRFTGFGKSENLPGSVQRLRITDPLRAEIGHLRFSPDGKYLLAQDDASIYVLTREPFSTLFRIDARGAYPAMFSPDSRAVLFHHRNFRVEKWDIASQEMTLAAEVYIRRGCYQSALSPLADLLACVQTDEAGMFPLQLTLYDVSSGEVVHTRKSITGRYPAGFGELLFQFTLLMRAGDDLINMAFSPDGKYLLAGSENSQFGFDTVMRKPWDVGRIGKYLGNGFAFLGSDRLAVIDGGKGEHSAVVRFPSGEPLITEIPMGRPELTGAAAGDYVIMRPVVHAPVGAMDLKKKQVYLASKTPALDIYDGIHASERRNGQLALYRGATLLASSDLPVGPLGNLHAVALSPDLRMLVASDYSRGTIWDLSAGSRKALVRGFRGAFVDAGGAIFASFPAPDSYYSRGSLTREEQKQSEKDRWREEQKKPGYSLVRIDAAAGQVSPLMELTQRTRVMQHGGFLLLMEPKEEDGSVKKNVDLAVHDVRGGQKLWSRYFRDGLPALFYNPVGGTMVIMWNINSDGAKALIKADPALKRQADAILQKENSMVVEILDHATGKFQNALVIDTGKMSFLPEDFDVVGDTVVISDNLGRLLLLSRSGERRGRIFGSAPVLNSTGSLLCYQAERGRLGLLDVATMNPLQQFTFARPVSWKQFSEDNRKLVVLTDDQNVFVIDVPQTAVAKQ